MPKKNIFFIQPLFFKPNLPNFKDQYEQLSKHFEGHIVAPTEGDYDGQKFGDFTYHQLPMKKGKFYYVRKIISLGLKLNKQKKFEYIHSWDPLFYGFAAVILKYLTGAKLIIEVNGHFKKDAFLEGSKIKNMIRKALFEMVIAFSIINADVVKFLNEDQVDEWKRYLKKKKTSIFHCYVPTHVFDPAISKDENYIFFLGYPFYRKAVDVLIKAFIRVSEDFPTIKLKIVGHCPGGETERIHYLKMAEGNKKVEILKPVYFDETIQMYQNCTFFVLPSRSEAMGRVLLEAMACGKAVIGGNAGGIPRIVKHNENGLLVDPGSIEDLEEKLRMLLSDVQLRDKLGRGGIDSIKQEHSSERYVDKFLNLTKMADS